MSGGVESYGYIFDGPDRTGRSMLIGLGRGDRFHYADGEDLVRDGFYEKIQSGEMYPSANVDVQFTLFWTGYFDANFVQMTTLKGGPGYTFWATGGPRSYLLTATASGKVGEVRISYAEMFAQDWKNMIDQMISGSGRRDREPILNWSMFPSYYPYLNSRLTYLQVHQDLIVFTPWPFPDYHVWMKYWIYLYPSGTGVRAHVPQSQWWVEGGTIHDQVKEGFVPKVQQGMTALQDQLNRKLAQFDGMAPRGLRDVYYLPGRQVEPAKEVLRGKTTDDVTIVAALNP